MKHLNMNWWTSLLRRTPMLAGLLLLLLTPLQSSAQGTACSPCSNAIDLAVNGDFSAGATGFTSALPLNCTCSSGSYCVGAEPRDKCNNSFWVNDLWDHTVGTAAGSYLLIDGVNGTSTVWTQNVNVIAGQTYNFSFWVMPQISLPTSGNPVNQANVNALVNGNVIGGTGTGTMSTTTWTNFCFSWTSNITGSVPITLNQVAANASWNDWGLDDISFTFCCNAVADAGPDATICLSQSTTLNATGGGTYAWSPAAGLSSTTIANPVANPTTTTVYTVTVTDQFGCMASDMVTVQVDTCPVNPCASAACNNPTELLTNGDFSAGATGFTSGYALNCTCAGNSYCVGAEPRDKCANSLWLNDLWDHTQSTAAGSYMLIDGTNTANVYTQNVAVTAGHIYYLSFWVMPQISLPNTGIPNGRPSLTATIDGNLVGTTGPVPGTATWTNFCYTYTATTTGTVPVSINQVAGSGFNDWGLDDVSLMTCCTVNPNAGADVAICQGTSTTLNASGGTSYSWSPATGLSSSTIANPIATPAVTTTYTVTVTDAIGCSDTASVTVTVDNCLIPCATCPNPDDQIVNGDFSLGNTGFTSSLAFNPTCASNSYDVGSEPRDKCLNSLWLNDLWDHTVGNSTGSYMLIDGSNNNVVYSAPVTVIAGNTYFFNFWVIPQISLPNSGVPNGRPSLTAMVGTDFVGATGPVPGTAQWVNYCFTYTPTTTGSFNMTINQVAASGYNDWGLDDISFSTCCTAVADAGVDQTICLGDNAQLNVTGPASATYTWTPAASLNNPNIPNPIATPTVDTEYIVTCTDQSGCSAVDTVLVEVDTCPPIISVDKFAFVAGSPTDHVYIGQSFQWHVVISNTGMSTATVDYTDFYPTSSTGGCAFDITLLGGSDPLTGTVTIPPGGSVTLIFFSKACNDAAIVGNYINCVDVEEQTTGQMESDCDTLQVLFGCPGNWTDETAEISGVPFTTTLDFHIPILDIEKTTFCVTYDPTFMTPTGNIIFAPVVIAANGGTPPSYTFVITPISATENRIDVMFTTINPYNLVAPNDNPLELEFTIVPTTMDCCSNLWSCGVTFNQTGGATTSPYVDGAEICLDMPNGMVQASVSATDQCLTSGTSTLSVTGTFDPLQSEFLWSTGAITSSIVVTQPGTYSVFVKDEKGCETTLFIIVGDCCESVCEIVDNTNLVVNGDFANNSFAPCMPISFQSDMNIDCTPFLAGNQYVVDNLAVTYNPQWSGMDHTPGGGTNFFIGDAGGTTQRAWYQTVNVSAGKNYVFSAWVRNLVRNNASCGCTGNSADFELRVDGVTIASLTGLDVDNDWDRLCGDYFANADMAVELQVVVLSGSGSGRDFGIDDIEFNLAGPVADAGPDKTICRFGSTTIGTPAVAGLTYEWRRGNNPNIIGTTAIINVSPNATSNFTVTVTDPLTGCSSFDVMTVTVLPLNHPNCGIIMGPPVSVSNLAVNPNPSNGNNVRVSFETTGSTKGLLIQVQVIDMYGKMVAKKTIAPDRLQTELETAAWAPGVYNVTLVQDGVPTLTKRLVVAH